MRRFKQFWSDGHRQAWGDIKTRWGRAAAALWFFGLCTCFGILYPFTAYGSAGSRVACMPDDSFSLKPEEFNYWSRSGFFQITLGFGPLTFEQAKVIDVVWDVIFGRGGQTILTIASWKIFAKYVTTSMEVMPVTFRTYRTIFIQDQPVFLAIPRLIHDFSTRLALHSRLAMTFMIISMAFILAFPTMGSAMTGYSSNVEAYVTAPDKSVFPFNAFSWHIYTIHDGHRIGLTKDTFVTLPQAFHDDPIPGEHDPYINSYTCDFNVFNGRWEVRSLQRRNKLTYPSDGKGNESTWFNGTRLDPPLNITKYRLSDEMYAMYPMFTSWAEREKSFIYSPYSNGERRWAFAQVSYTEKELIEKGNCQVKAGYQWGFSFIQLNLMIIFLAIWTIGIGIMLVHSEHTMERRGRATTANEHEAILELAQAMNKELTAIDDDTSGLRGSELCRRIDKDLRGGSIAYSTSLLSNNERESRFSSSKAKASLKRNGLWVFLFLASTAAGMAIVFLLSYSAWFALCIYTWTFGLALAIAITTSVGSTGKSRAVLFWWSFWLLCAVPGVTIDIWILRIGRQSYRMYWERT